MVLMGMLEGGRVVDGVDGDVGRGQGGRWC